MSSMAQANPKTSWLDEELRKEKTIVAELRDVVENSRSLSPTRHSVFSHWKSA
jgi:hypothetical protein